MKTYQTMTDEEKQQVRDLGIDPGSFYSSGEGFALWIAGPETEATEDTDWDGTRKPTGRVLAVMVGDDRRIPFEPGDLEKIGDHSYCAVCGQIGCSGDGVDRSEDEEE